MSSDPYTPIPSINTGADATVVMPGTGGDAPRPPATSNPLPLGHAIQDYVIVGLVGEGGFGIVYLARDNLGRMVALKEYMPAALASRGPDHEVRVQSERQRETFELGRRSFVNEAQLLAAFDQPSLVKVYRFWEQNGTAYMVMPFYEGPTFKQWLLEHGSPSQDWLLGLLAPLMDALELMHQNRCYHRDIAPDNILLVQQPSTQTGAAPAVRPVLLDFGAARRVIGDASQVLTVILKPGYAPIEQYAESASMKQGAWTDVYALCAVLYAAVSGRAPQPSVGRVVNDEMVPAVQVGAGRYTPAFLAVIDQGLAIRPDQRPQDMAALRELFRAAVPADERPLPESEARETPPAAPGAGAPVDGPSMRDAAQASVGAKAAEGPGPAAPRTERTPPRSRTEPALARPGPGDPDLSPTLARHPPQADSRLMQMMLVGGGVLVLVAAGTWWALRPQPAPALAPDPAPVSASAVAAASGSSIASAASADSAASRSTAAAGAVAPVADAGASSVPPPVGVKPSLPSASGQAFDVVTALEDIVKQADPLHGVNVLADRSQLTIGRDRLQFRVKSSESGHLYVFLSGTDKSHFYLLFPNALDKDNRIAANREVVLPRKSWHITAAGPAGTDHLVVVVSKNPRDFAGTGLTEKPGEVSEFDMERASQLWAGRPSGGGNPFIGQAKCAVGGPCDGDYGATLLTIEEVVGGRRR